jgi:probable rRNA maturation factor
MKVDVVVKQRAHRVPASPLAAFARRLAEAKAPGGADALTILLAGDKTMRGLNRTFRGKDQTTDVLSFPSGEDRLVDGTLPLGEIAISVPQAARQAEARGHSLPRELRVLVIHGYLHLLGYDHEVDDGSMMRLQARLVRRLLPAVRR